jgi:predicted nucleic acid-binding protein
MKPFLDTSVLVEACLLNSPKFGVADSLVRSRRACTSAHALAEAYATLSGDKRLKINPQDAAQMVADLAAELTVATLEAGDYVPLIHAAPGKGVYGGSFFDAIHAEVARHLKCDEIHTINVRHFTHVAPDLRTVPL